MSSAGLSVAIIVRDAAEALRETLVSARSFADEIVVVDTGSTDDSRLVAEQAGARVFDHAWQDDFAAARNACLSHVQGEWVLWLDAGEQVSAEDASQLREFISGSADATKAYALVVQIPPQQPHLASEQVARIRLLPNQIPIRFAGRVGESALESLAQAGLQVEGLPQRIIRGSREHDSKHKTAKARRNVRLAELEIKEQGGTPRLLNCLGDAFHTLNDFDRAAQFFRHSLEGCERGSTDMLEAYYGLLTSLDGDEKNREQQLQLAVQANEVFPLDAQLLCAMGGYLQAVGRTDLAARSYQTAFQYGQIIPEVWHVPEVRDIAAICHSITLQLQDKLNEAQQTLEAAVAANERSVRLRRHLIEMYVKRGRRDEALAQVDVLPQDTPHRDALPSAVRGACLAVQQNWIAAKSHLQTAYTAGCLEPFCLRWLGISLLNAGEVDEARQVLQQWQTLDPRSDEATRLLTSLERQLADGQSVPEPANDRQWRIDAAQQHTGIPPTPSPISTHHVDE